MRILRSDAGAANRCLANVRTEESRLDRLVGLDDGRDRRKRRPLWQRALWRAIKRLVGRYPRAALSATVAGAGYAVVQGTREGIEMLAEKMASFRNAPAPAQEPDAIPELEGQRRQAATASARNEGQGGSATACEPMLTTEQRRELVNSLRTEDREQLAELARHSSETREGT